MAQKCSPCATCGRYLRPVTGAQFLGCLTATPWLGLYCEHHIPGKAMSEEQAAPTAPVTALLTHDAPRTAHDNLTHDAPRTAHDNITHDNSAMKIILTRTPSFTGALIKWQTRSPYVHAILMSPDDQLIEAKQGHGVRQITLDDLQGEDYDVFQIDSGNLSLPRSYRPAKVWRFAENQLGKKYDWTMVARFLTRRQEERKSRGQWFCSELVFAAFIAGGLRLLKHTEPWEVSPGMLARSPYLKKTGSR